MERKNPLKEPERSTLLRNIQGKFKLVLGCHEYLTQGKLKRSGAFLFNLLGSTQESTNTKKEKDALLACIKRGRLFKR
ncbi:MAG: hypothetical protein P8J27_09740 [Mariniblastus sp.]|nr:hypothetical protein [Mariniblastus sp.]